MKAEWFVVAIVFVAAAFIVFVAIDTLKLPGNAQEGPPTIAQQGSQAEHYAPPAAGSFNVDGVEYQILIGSDQTSSLSIDLRQYDCSPRGDTMVCDLKTQQ